MDNPRPEKVAVVAEVRDRLDASEAVVLTEYRGLNVRDLAELRKALADAGGEYKVYKNTMVRFAANELELDIDELLVGPTAIAFTGTRPDGSAGDPVSIAKALTEFGKTNDNLVIKGGLLEGRALSTDEIAALSKIAPREELLARLAGGMAAPMQQFAALLNAVNAKFAYALKALIDAGGAPGAPESVPADSAASEDDSGADAAGADEASNDNPEATADDAEAEETPTDDGVGETESGEASEESADSGHESADSGETEES